MERIGEILSRLLSRGQYKKRLQQGPVFERWEEVVGEFLAGKCRPRSIHKGVLVVGVEDSVWMQELHMHKGQILKKISDLAGPGIVEDIRWTIDSRRHPASVPPRPKMEKQKKQTEKRPLTEEQREWIESLARKIKDPDLRGTLERTLESYLSNSKGR